MSPRFHHAPFADQAGGHAPSGRADKVKAAFAQNRHIGLRRRVRPHAAVHGGHDDDRAARGERRDGEQIIGLPVSEFGDRVRRRRSDDQQIGFLAQLHVRHMLIVPPQIVVGQRRSPGHRGKRHRPHELRRGLGQDHIDQRAGLRQLAGEIGHLVRGNSAAHAENNIFVVEKRNGFHSR